MKCLNKLTPEYNYGELAKHLFETPLEDAFVSGSLVRSFMEDTLANDELSLQILHEFINDHLLEILSSEDDEDSYFAKIDAIGYFIANLPAINEKKGIISIKSILHAFPELCDAVYTIMIIRSKNFEDAEKLYIPFQEKIASYCENNPHFKELLDGAPLQNNQSQPEDIASVEYLYPLSMLDIEGISDITWRIIQNGYTDLDCEHAHYFVRQLDDVIDYLMQDEYISLMFDTISGKQIVKFLTLPYKTALNMGIYTNDPSPCIALYDVMQLIERDNLTNKSSFINSFVHEHTHALIDMMYQNNSYPYTKSDDKKKADIETLAKKVFKTLYNQLGLTTSYKVLMNADETEKDQWQNDPLFIEKLLEIGWPEELGLLSYDKEDISREMFSFYMGEIALRIINPTKKSILLSHQGLIDEVNEMFSYLQSGTLPDNLEIASIIGNGSELELDVIST